MKYCLYYRAHLVKEQCWLVTSTLRYSEQLVFDRCFDKEQSIFEFFVTPEFEDVFLKIMKKLEEKELVFNLQKLPNRLMQEGQTV